MQNYDAIIMGAGPAGCTAGTLLAQYGHKVLILEKEQFPRHCVGESFMPCTYNTLRRLGVWEQLHEIGFVRKHSVQFVSQRGKASQPFYFTENDPHERSITWQVERSDFDQLLMQNAQKNGVEIVEQVKVVSVIFQGEHAVGVVAEPKGGESCEIFARVIIDATGTNALLARQLKIYESDPCLKKTALFSYFKGAKRDCGVDGGATLIIHTANKEGWFWFIPLRNGVTSIGVVSDAHVLYKDSKDKQQVFSQQINNNSFLTARLKEAEQIKEVYACGDFSYRAKQLAGPGYVLIGDAFGFIDPVYSSGIFLALVSGEMAADTIHEAFTKNDFSQDQLGKFGEKLIPGMNSLKQLVYYFYTHDFSFAQFLKANPQYRQNLIDLLIGDVFKEGINEIFVAMKDYLPQTVLGN